jgi:hypothetical protein
MRNKIMTRVKKLKLIFLSVLIVLAFASCKQNKTNNDTSKEESDYVRLFAQDRPSGQPFVFNMQIDKGLDNLELTDSGNEELDSNELVLGISLANSHIAVPIKYLSGFEVANLVIGDDNFVLTYCPLVGSARLFNGKVNGTKSGFDFGRGLKDNNLLIIDRETKSVWNQLSGKAIEGKLKGKYLSPIESIQSTWGFWKAKYPTTKVAINKDTSNAAFPEEILQKRYYNTWMPGKERPNNSEHQIQNLGLGIDLGSLAIFFPLETLFEGNSPLIYRQKNEEVYIHFDSSGLTAWAENKKGGMIPSTIVYDWAWNNFYPNTIVFKK